MLNLKEIRLRIASVQSTQKITSAMKLVSASKLRHAQHDISNLKPYSCKLNTILENLSFSADIVVGNPLFAIREPENVVLIVITSNKGLCGAFNSNIIKEVHSIAHEEYATQLQAEKLKLVCIGKKAVEYLQKNYEIMYANESLLDHPNFEEVNKIASDLLNDFMQKKIDKIVIIYNSFVNTATQKITLEDYLPVMNAKKNCSQKTRNADYIFEPSPEVFMNELIPKILKLQLYKALLDSIAAEHGARMTAMAKATDSAIEILKDLKLKYNNARQATITNELNEIVGGAETLKN
ncbi:MAG: ATP synthase F1 subunit gamma [Lentimicrobiaceae bacterium]|nr:ATP synthase F1 subunit gamma [Lentimicrobiaceae bacterium]